MKKEEDEEEKKYTNTGNKIYQYEELNISIRGIQYINTKNEVYQDEDCV